MKVSKAEEETPDQAGPALTFLAPADMSYYASTVIVAGRVGDFQDTPGSTEEVKSLFYEVEGVPSLAAEISYDFDGAYTNLSGEVPETDKLILIQSLYTLSRQQIC